MEGPSRSPGQPSRCSVETISHPSGILKVLHYLKQAFDDENTLDNLPLKAAGNPGAWKAWQAHRKPRRPKIKSVPSSIVGKDKSQEKSNSQAQRKTAEVPDEWNWDGVWQERIRKGVDATISEPVLFGGVGVADDIVHFPTFFLMFYQLTG